MPALTRDLPPAGLAGLALTLPLLALELVNSPTGEPSIPELGVLYSVVWLLPTAFVLLLLPLARRFRASTRPPTSPLRLALGVPAMALIAIVWIALLIDQWPCFLGVPNCD
jgi:hypothetical protein